MIKQNYKAIMKKQLFLSLILATSIFQPSHTTLNSTLDKISKNAPGKKDLPWLAFGLGSFCGTLAMVKKYPTLYDVIKEEQNNPTTLQSLAKLSLNFLKGFSVLFATFGAAEYYSQEAQNEKKQDKKDYTKTLVSLLAHIGIFYTAYKGAQEMTCNL